MAKGVIGYDANSLYLYCSGDAILCGKDLFYFILFTLSLMLTITEQILFTIKNSNKMLIDVKALVKKTY